MSSHITNAAPSADGRTWGVLLTTEVETSVRRSHQPPGGAWDREEVWGRSIHRPFISASQILFILSSHWSSSQAKCPRHALITHPPSNRPAPTRPRGASLNCGERKDHRRIGTGRLRRRLRIHYHHISHEYSIRSPSYSSRWCLGQGEVDCPDCQLRCLNPSHSRGRWAESEARSSEWPQIAAVLHALGDGADH